MQASLRDIAGHWFNSAGVAVVVGMLASVVSASAVAPPPTTPTNPPSSFVEPSSLLKLMLEPTPSRPADAANVPPAASPDRLHTWELPPVKVVGDRQSDLREEDRVGSYGQPRWTADRRFPGTRTYVIPEDKVEAEYWLVPEVPRHGGTMFRSLYELEVGLPHRFQVDLYFRTDQQQGERTEYGGQFEVRYALADWGKIWGNPALYVEYARFDTQPDTVEGKLLLTDELAPRWHWGVNLSYEAEITGARTHEYEFTGGISYTVVDEKLSVGVETEDSVVDEQHHRGHFTNEVKFGPTIQWRPVPAMHVDFAPLFGVTNQSPLAKLYFIVGWEF